VLAAEEQRHRQRRAQRLLDAHPTERSRLLQRLPPHLGHALGHGEHGLLGRGANERLGRAAQLAEQQRRQPRRCEALLLTLEDDVNLHALALGGVRHLEAPARQRRLEHLVVPAAAEQQRDVHHRVRAVARALALCWLADELLGLSEGDHGGREPRALLVGDHLDARRAHHGHAAVGVAKVDAEHGAAVGSLGKISEKNEGTSERLRKKNTPFPD